MRTTLLRLAAAAVLGTVLTAAPAVAATAPAPTPGHEIGTVFSRDLHGLPYCPVGYGYVVVDHHQAVLVSGSGHFINEVLDPGQSVEDHRGGTLTFHKDGRTLTYNDYEHHDGRPVTARCTPHA